MAKSLLGLSHCFMLLACRFIPENSPLIHRYPVLVYAQVSLTTHSRVNGCSSFSPHSFAVLYLTWLEQTALYSLILELKIGMQTVRKVPNTRSGVRSNTVYIPIEFNGEFAIAGSPRHPKRDVTYLINIPYIFWTCWERAIEEVRSAVSGKRGTVLKG